jgi:uncharacterized protein
VFDEWYAGDTQAVSVRLFDAVLNYLVDGNRVVCTMGSDCRQYFVVEYNGDIYPCDFFVEAGTKLGNILEQDWDELLQSELYRSFGQQKAQLNPLCTSCLYLEICAGDCLKHRFQGPPEQRDPRTLSWLCAGWKLFYDHTMERFQRLVRRVQRQRSQELQRRVQAPGCEVPADDRSGRGRLSPRQMSRAAVGGGSPALGRNDPCPCGSGKKYKHCHGAL